MLKIRIGAYEFAGIVVKDNVKSVIATLKTSNNELSGIDFLAQFLDYEEKFVKQLKKLENKSPIQAVNLIGKKNQGLFGIFTNPRMWPKINVVLNCAPDKDMGCPTFPFEFTDFDSFAKFLYETVKPYKKKYAESRKVDFEVGGENKELMEEAIKQGKIYS